MLKEQILKLKEQGLSTGEIMKELKCSRNIIWYHFNPKKKEHREKNLCENLGFKKYINRRIYAFQTVSLNNREYKAENRTNPFSYEEFITKFGKYPKCAISGKQIDLSLYTTWSLDHKIPKKNGGDNSLDNCQVVLREFNFIKSYLTEEELVENCKLILQNKGFKIMSHE